jgi:hypothetical protein
MLRLAASSRAWAAAAAALVNSVVVLVVLLQAAVVLPVWSCAGDCAFGPACSCGDTYIVCFCHCAVMRIIRRCCCGVSSRSPAAAGRFRAREGGRKHKNMGHVLGTCSLVNRLC